MATYISDDPLTEIIPEDFVIWNASARMWYVDTTKTREYYAAAGFFTRAGSEVPPEMRYVYLPPGTRGTPGSIAKPIIDPLIPPEIPDPDKDAGGTPPWRTPAPPIYGPFPDEIVPGTGGIGTYLLLGAAALVFVLNGKGK